MKKIIINFIFLSSFFTYKFAFADFNKNIIYLQKNIQRVIDNSSSLKNSHHSNLARLDLQKFLYFLQNIKENNVSIQWANNAGLYSFSLGQYSYRTSAFYNLNSSQEVRIKYGHPAVSGNLELSADWYSYCHISLANNIFEHPLLNILILHELLGCYSYLSLNEIYNIDDSYFYSALLSILFENITDESHLQKISNELISYPRSSFEKPRLWIQMAGGYVKVGGGGDVTELAKVIELYKNIFQRYDYEMQ